jgi:hypothetical protein
MIFSQLNIIITIKGLRLFKINDVLIKNEGYEGLKKIKKMIYNLNNNTIKYEFLEPLLVISIYSSILDIEMDSIIYTLKLPIGAVYDILKFSNDIQNIINQQGYPLNLITIRLFCSVISLVFSLFVLLFFFMPYWL